MAGSVSDIIINITANASKAIEGLNQVKTQVTNTVNETGKGLANFRNSSKDAAEGVNADFASAGAALGNFEKQAGINFRAGGNQITGFGGKITVFGKDVKANLTSAGKSISDFGKNVQEKMGTQSALAFAAAGGAALSFSKQCITGAMNAEASWSRYGALVNSSGGNWQAQQKEVKEWARDVSNSYGYAVSDTREASATLMQAGNSFDFVKNNMASVSALAARTGTTQAEAANMITMALNGRAQALKKATGLEIENYRAADGTIDKQRLMTDILNQNKDALDAHSETTEAAVARMENSWGALKTSLGQAMLPVIQAIIPVIQAIADAFNKLPAPVKTGIAAFLLVGGAIATVLGVVGMIAPALITAGELIVSIGGTIGGAIGAIGGVISTISGAIGAAGGIIPAVSAAFGGLAAAAAPVLAALAPIIAVAIAVAAAFYLLYEAGKRMGWWSDLGGMIGKFGETLSWVGGQIMGFVQWLGLLFTDFPAAMSQLSNFVNGIGPALGNFLSQLGPFLGQVGSVIVDALSGLGSAVMGALSGLGGWIMDALGNIDLGAVASAISPIGTIIVNAISYFGPMVLSALQGLGQWIADGLGQALSGVGGAIGDALGGVGDRIREMLNGIWSIFTGFIQGDLGSIMDGLVDFFGPTLGGAMATALAGLHTWVMDGLNNAFSDIPGTIGRIIDATPVGQIVSSLGGKLSTALSQLPSMIMGALSGLGGAIAGALSNLGNSVDGGGLASGIRAMLTPIPTLVGALLGRIGPIVRPILANAWNGIIATFRQLATRILTTITSIPTRIGMAFMRIVTIIRLRINQARAIASTLMTQLRNAVVNRILSIPQRVGMIFQLVVQFIRTRLVRAWAIAQQVAGQIRQAIVDKIMEMYHGVQQWFGTLASNIGSWLSTAAANTLSGAKQIYDNIVNKVKDIPGKVAEEFGKIPGKISSALAQAASAALQGAQAIVSNFLSGMSINSPGMIQRWTEWEFNSIPENITKSGVEATRNAYKAATNIVNAWTDAMPNMMQPNVNYGTVPSVHDLRGRNMNNQTVGTRNTYHEDNTRYITIENVTLDCNNLTQAQSRRILYNALQGL